MLAKRNIILMLFIVSLSLVCLQSEAQNKNNVIGSKSEKIRDWQKIINLQKQAFELYKKEGQLSGPGKNKVYENRKKTFEDTRILMAKFTDKWVKDHNSESYVKALFKLGIYNYLSDHYEASNYYFLLCLEHPLINNVRDNDGPLIIQVKNFLLKCEESSGLTWWRTFSSIIPRN